MPVSSRGLERGVFIWGEVKTTDLLVLWGGDRVFPDDFFARTPKLHGFQVVSVLCHG